MYLGLFKYTIKSYKNLFPPVQFFKTHFLLEHSFCETFGNGELGNGEKNNDVCMINQCMISQKVAKHESCFATFWLFVCGT